MTTMAIALGAYAFVLLVLFLIRNAVSLFWTASIFTVASIAYIKVGIQPPIPAFVVALFVGTLLICMLLYVTASEASREAFFGPIVAMMVEKRLVAVRWFVLLTVPALLAWQGYELSLPSAAPPPRARSVHPPPPNSITFQGPNDSKSVTIDLIKGDNPLRPLETDDPEAFKEKVAEGKVIYYQNCYYCHGDHLMADGHYADSVKPVPADFQDPGVLAMLQEAFLFWRIAKGGPGLPSAGTPWDSSMPVWEKFLSEDEIWSVVLFLYDHTGYKPRAREEVHH